MEEKENEKMFINKNVYYSIDKYSIIHDYY